MNVNHSYPIIAREESSLIPWELVSNNGVVATQENSRPEGKWALILNAFLSPSPGRTLDQVYTATGKVLENQANRIAFKLGLGPHVIAGKIKLHFGDGEHRMQQLELLRIIVPPKLEKQCLKLMKYSLPTEFANTQCQAFKEIVDLVTLLPGLRVLFLQTKVLDNVTSLDTISALWDRSTGPPDKEWIFWQTLAVTGYWFNMIGLIEEAPVDYDGVDLLTTTLLGGLSNWFGKLDRKNWTDQPWYGSFAQVLQLLWDQNHTVPTEQSTHAANHSMDNLSAHTIKSDHDANQESSKQGIESLDDSQSQTSNLSADRLSLQDDESLSSDFSDPMINDTGSDLSEYEEQFGTASGHGDVLEDLINGTTGIPRISGTQSVLASTPYYSPEARRKDLEEKKLILFNKQRDLGENHPETLKAMENLAWLHHELGKYVSARDLRLTVLEKYQILGGEDNPTALQVMEALGITHCALGQYKEAQEVTELALEKQRKVLAIAYLDLGQFNKAQELAMSAVEKQSQLLGEYHPDTLWPMHTLAYMYHLLGQFTEAEDQYHIVVEKRMNQLKKAENLLTVVFDKQKKVLGEEHPDTIFTMGQLASTYNHLSQLSAAEELATVALERHQKVFGEDHPETLWIMGELAFQQQGQLEHAEELLVTVLEKRRKLLGDDHPYTRWTTEKLANIYQSMGKLQAAEELEKLIGDQ
ncbi:hypothetical protein DFH08DRAFT_1026306 [Mycena albidolilacea]|uniref:Kinesin light chain n=1 Tax=Mycena albidolilacea TaxID=1033008 RepID=A0AAD6ZK44_9AGAR|nr:hypothetical protein DFH08DRAFT_1026306 [Mycena albidolilacea]